MRIALVTILLLVAACGDAPQTEQLREAVRNEPPPPPLGSVAFRFAGRQGADVRPYQLPRLSEVNWRFRTPGLVASRALGFGSEDDRVWVLTPEGNLVALDLETGRARVFDSLVTQATLDPRGAPIVVSRSGAVRLWHSRSPRTIADSLSGTIETLHGTVDGRVLVVTRSRGERRLRTLEAGDRILPGTVIPDGPIAFSTWGDVVAVAADSGLWIRERDQREGDRFLSGDVAQALAFSGSAHRLYVARGSRIDVIERNDLVVLARMRLPAEPTALRADPWGRYLLARHPHGDSLWVVPLEGEGAPVVVPGAWDPELPTVSPDGRVLARVGRDVVAWDSAGAERGRVSGGAVDRWAVAAWDARRPDLQLTAEAASTDQPAESQQLYVQVSSTSNPSWADDLARDLRQAGMRAAVLAPTEGDEMYRVVVGPFATREEAEATGRMLGMPFWIFSPTGDPDAQ